jgi:hypothetical protein
MRSAVKLIVFPLLIMALCSFAFSCITIKAPGGSSSDGKNNSSSSQSSGAITRPHPPVRTGDINLGTRVDLASQSVGTSGGTIAVSKPGDPLDGFVISVPPSSFPDSKNFKISEAPITKQSFGSDINPVSPMITVENGGAFSNKPIYVRIPVKVPEGYFAMGFIYDEKTKQLEGLPLVGTDPGSITVATRHFSSFFVSIIEKALLAKDTDSGFRPGIDDWQFINIGSAIAPDGHCEGQSLTAMWYYCTTPDGKDMCLYGRYDNNGKKPETPELWEDDSFGYRFSSIVQTDNRDQFSDDFFINLQGKNWVLVNNKWELKDVPGIGDGGTFNLFSYSIRATREPQEVGIYSSTGGGHAMIVYKVVGNSLYVADPNYPGNTDRKITYYSGEGKFKSYNSGSNRKAIEAGEGQAYETIQYLAKTAVVPWETIAGHWTEFKAGTIGNDKFPAYQINVVDDGGQVIELKDGYVSKQSKLRADVGTAGLLSKTYRDGIILKRDADQKIDLVHGNNDLGFYVFKRVVTVVNNQQVNDDQYIDFKHITVKSDVDVECKTPPPANVMAKFNKTTLFKCELLNLPTDIEGHGSMNKWVPGFKWTKHFYVPGNFNTMPERDGSMPIQWSGNSFSGGTKGYDQLRGYICWKDGKALLTFDYVILDPKDALRFSVKDVPLNPRDASAPYMREAAEFQYLSTDAPTVKKFVTRLEWTSHEERTMYGGQVQVWDARLVSQDWSKQCGFQTFFR